MSTYYEGGGVTVLHGDCIEKLKALPDTSVHAVVTDPPYGLSSTDPAHVVEALGRWMDGDRSFLPSGAGFMGKAWDSFVPPPAVWDEAMRVLKPGGHLLAFAGSRTFDLMTLSIRIAGFDIRDGIAWLYGSGFPKSLDVSKAIDASLGAERNKVRRPTAASAYAANAGNHRPWMDKAAELGYVEVDDSKPATESAREWEGWGTALKPAFEPIVVARKPLAGTVAANVLAHGTGAINIDATRIATDEDRRRNARGGDNGLNGQGTFRIHERHIEDQSLTSGRWPANVVLDESQAAALDEQSGTLTSGMMRAGQQKAGKPQKSLNDTYGDSGGASRFFPTFEMSEADWEWERRVASLPTFRYEAKAPTSERPSVDGVQHPTVKPLDLMRWLVRLVTPPGGTVLEPFAGSGTTVEACLLEGFSCIAIEREADYLPLIMSRIQKDHEQSLFGDWEGGAA